MILLIMRAVTLSQVPCLVLLVLRLHVNLAKLSALSGAHTTLRPAYASVAALSKINRSSVVNLPVNRLRTPPKMMKDDGSQTFRSPQAERVHAAYLNRPTPIQNPLASNNTVTVIDVLSEGDDVVILIYEVEYGIVYPMKMDKLSELQPHCTYLVIRANHDEEPENLTIYYWVGQYSKHEDNGNAAAYALSLDANVHQRVQIRREAEGQESDAFKALFEEEIKKVATRKNSQNFDDTRIRMFLTEGLKENPRFKEVQPLLRYIPNPDVDQCMVYVSERVHVFCANKASDRKKQVAEELAKFIGQRRGIEAGEIIFHRGDKEFWEVERGEREDFMRVVEEIERIPSELAQMLVVDIPTEFTPKEMRKILGQTSTTDEGEEIFPLKMVRFSLDVNTKTVVRQETSAVVLPLTLMDPHDTYFIDTRSNLGFIVWVGKKSASAVRAACGKYAERQLFENGCKYTTPITFIDPEDVPEKVADVQDMIHFIDSEELWQQKTLRAINKPIENLELLEFNVPEVDMEPTVSSKPVENLEPENNVQESIDIKGSIRDGRVREDAVSDVFSYLKRVTGKSKSFNKKSKQSATSTTVNAEQVVENSMASFKLNDGMTQISDKLERNSSFKEDASILEPSEKIMGEPITIDLKLKDSASKAKSAKRTKKHRSIGEGDTEGGTSKTAAVNEITNEPTIQKLVSENNYELKKVKKSTKETKKLLDDLSPSKSLKNVREKKSSIKNLELENDSPKADSRSAQSVFTKMEQSADGATENSGPQDVSITEPTKKVRNERKVENSKPEDHTSESKTTRKSRNRSGKNSPSRDSLLLEEEQSIEDPLRNFNLVDSVSVSKSMKKVQKQKLAENFNTGNKVLPEVSDYGTSEEGEPVTGEVIPASPRKGIKQTTKRSTSKVKNKESASEVAQPTTDEPVQVRRRGRPRKSESENQK